MVSASKYAGATPAAAEPNEPSGVWAGQELEPLLATPAGGLRGTRVAERPSTNADASSGEAAPQPASVGLDPNVAAMLAALSAQTAATNAMLGTLGSRLDHLESRSRAASDAESEQSDTESSDSEPTAPVYLTVDAESRHWHAAERALDADQRPRQHSLYGYEPHDLLRAGRHTGGGTLGMVMQYAEPLALYLSTALNGVRAVAASLDYDDPIAGDLDACANTLSGCYGLANTLRSIVVERAQVQASGATVGDKKRQQWVEAQLNEDDLGRADVAPRIRKLKAQYDYEAGKQELRKLASGGSSARGGLAENEQSGRSRSAKRRDRKERERSKSRSEYKTDKPRGGDRPRDEKSRRDRPRADEPRRSDQRRPEREDRRDSQPRPKAAERKPAGERGRGDQHDKSKGGGGRGKGDGRRDGGGKGRRGGGSGSDAGGQGQSGASDWSESS